MEKSFQIHHRKVLVSETIGSVSIEIFEPKKLRTMLVLAHGAGAGMMHDFMVRLCTELATLSIGTIRYNFPFMESGKKRPDLPATAHKTVASVLVHAHTNFPDTPLFAGGKSFGGRMTSQYVAKNPPSFLKGIVFYGFPLHPAGNPSVERAEHLNQIKLPMLFLQGTRDALAELTLIESVCKQLSTATLIKLEGADHAFKVARKNILPELATHTESWMDKVCKD